MPRRKSGTLIPIELRILASGIRLQSGGEAFYGFALAKRLAEGEGAHGLTAHGTLYKALSRMTEAGLLEARWEDADAAATANRPRRRLYRVTGEGERALGATSASATKTGATPLQTGLGPVTA